MLVKKIISLLLIFALSISLVPAIETSIFANDEVVNIPDPNLEEVIRETLGKFEGDISKSDMESFTAIIGNKRGIVDLTGLEYAINLTWLVLRDNEIRDISPIGNLTNLNDLELRYNEISDISYLSSLINLTRLNLYGNEISDICSLSNITNLTHLDLGSNQINRLDPLRNLTNLTSLGLNNNQISDVSPLSSLTNLNLLSLDWNQISELSHLSNLTNLSRLHLDKNQISDINPLSNLSNLTHLSLGFKNQIRDISALENLANLTYLYIWDNEISDLTPLSNLTNLTNLGLWGNKISDIEPLRNLTNLTTLQLYNNQISDISPLSNLTNLINLYIWNNPINNSSTPGAVHKAELDFIVNDSYYEVWIKEIAFDLKRNSIIIKKGEKANLEGGLTSKSDLIAVSLAVSGWHEVENGIYATIEPNSNTLDLSEFEIDTNKAPFNKNGVHKVNLWARSKNMPVASMPLSTITVTVVNDETNEVYIPDPNLEQAIRDKLGKYEGRITTVDMQNLTVLNAERKGIVDLTGLEYAISLTWLNLESNAISDISSISNLTNLTWLNLNSNEISDISPIRNLKKLNSLFLGNDKWRSNNDIGNNINDISYLSNLTNLKQLNLNDNSVSDITSLKNLTNITCLWLENNKIVDIKTLEYLHDLERLYLDNWCISYDSPSMSNGDFYKRPNNNKISDISTISKLYNLKELGLSYNYISDLSALSNLINLEVLNIENWIDLENIEEQEDNLINDISHLENMANMRRLNLNYNKISDISPLLNMTNLNDIQLRLNRINDISVLSNHNNLGFIDMDNTLSRGYYGIGVIGVGNQISDISSLSNLTNLYNINLSDNQISDISPLNNLTNLRSISLSGNQISDISSLSNLTNLYDISLHNNQISDTGPLGNLSNATYLGLGGNQIIDIRSLGKLTNLSYLSLWRNQINDISPLSNLTNLSWLILSNNPINDSSTPGAVHKPELDFTVDGQLYEVWVVEEEVDDEIALNLKTNNIRIIKGSTANLEGSITSKSDLIAVSLAVSGWHEVENGIYATINPNSNTLDLSEFKIDTNKAPFNKNGVHKVNLWARSKNVPVASKALATITVTVTDSSLEIVGLENITVERGKIVELKGIVESDSNIRAIELAILKPSPYEGYVQEYKTIDISDQQTKSFDLSNIKIDTNDINTFPSYGDYECHIWVYTATHWATSPLGKVNMNVYSSLDTTDIIENYEVLTGDSIQLQGVLKSDNDIEYISVGVMGSGDEIYLNDSVNSTQFNLNNIKIDTKSKPFNKGGDYVLSLWVRTKNSTVHVAKVLNVKVIDPVIKYSLNEAMSTPTETSTGTANFSYGLYFGLYNGREIIKEGVEWSVDEENKNLCKINRIRDANNKYTGAIYVESLNNSSSDKSLKLYAKYNGKTYVQNIKLGVKQSAINVIVWDGNNSLIKGATVTIGTEKSVTQVNGTAGFKSMTYGSYRLKIELDGYIPYETDFVISERNLTKVVELKRDIRIPYIESVNLNQNNREYNLLYIDKTINRSEDTIKVNVNWNNIQGNKKVEIMQNVSGGGGSGGVTRITSTNGIFSEEDLKKLNNNNNSTFVLLRVDGKEVTGSRKRIRLRFEEPKSIVDGTKKISLGEAAKFRVPENMPILGDMSFEIKFNQLPFKIIEEQDTIKIIIGIEERKLGDLDNLAKGNNWASFKTPIDDIKKTVKESTDAAKKSLKNFNDLKRLTNAYGAKSGNFSLAKGWEASFDAYGYLEYNKLDKTYSGGIVFSIESSFEMQNQHIVGFVPIYTQIGFGVSACSNIGIKFDDDKLAIGDANIELKTELTLGVGLGIARVATAGVEGKGTLLLQLTLPECHYKVTLGAEMSIVLRALFLEHRFILPSKNDPLGPWTLYDSKTNTVKAQGIEEPFDFDIYDSSRFTMMDRSYINNPSEWMPEDNMFHAFGLSSSNKKLTTVKTNIFTDSRPKLVQFGDKEMMVWVDDSAERSDANRTMLLYSVYNPDTSSWSIPKAVYDDNTADFHPQLAVLNDEVYVVWQNINKTFESNTLTLEDYAASSEITVAKYNETEDVFEKVTTITNNDTLDYQPQLATGKDKIAVIWVNNDGNDIFGVAGKNKIMYSELVNSTWSEPKVLADSLNSIMSLSAAFYEEELYVAYNEDEDNDLHTIDDRNIKAIKVNTDGNILKSQITDNDTIDSNPVFAMVNNRLSLFWYNDQNIVYIPNLKTMERKTVFEGSRNGLTDDFRVLSDNIGNTSIIWSQNSDSFLEIYGSLYDRKRDEWSEIVKLSDLKDKSYQPDGIMYEDGSFKVLFSSTKLEPVYGDEGEVSYNEGHTNLCLLEIIPSYNLSLEDSFIYYDNSEIIINQGMNLTFEVSNKGELTVEKAEVQVFDGENNLNNTEIIDIDLRPGESREISVMYFVPEGIDMEEVTIKITPYQKEDTDMNDNFISTVIKYADIAIDDVIVAKMPTFYSIITDIVNNSHVPVENVVLTIREDSEEGDIIYVQEIGSLSPYGGNSAIFNINAEDISFNDSFKRFHISIESEAQEYRTWNNYETIIIANPFIEEPISTFISDITEDGENLILDILAVNNHPKTNTGILKVNVLDSNTQNIIKTLTKPISLEPSEIKTVSFNIDEKGYTHESNIFEVSVTLEEYIEMLPLYGEIEEFPVKADISSDKMWTVEFNHKVDETTMDNVYIAFDKQGTKKVKDIEILAVNEEGKNAVEIYLEDKLPKGTYYLIVRRELKNNRGSNLDKNVIMAFEIL